MGYYDTAQICLNGHVINANSGLCPQHNQKHCSLCGESTTEECLHCHSPIRGAYEADGVMIVGDVYSRPSFCDECGKPYPWTEEGLRAAKELANEFEELSPIEQEHLKDSIEELVKAGPKTDVASFRFKRLAAKLQKNSWAALKSILNGLLTEAVKQAIGIAE